jgi:hypothetical protein
MSTYREEVLRTARRDWGPVRKSLNDEDALNLLNAAMGLAGEAGEFADRVKKILLHGDRSEQAYLALRLELGDIRWYLELATVALKTSLPEIEEMNVKKLRARYPTGFNEADAATAKRGPE